MKKRFTEQPIAFAVPQAEQGTAVEEITGRMPPWSMTATVCNSDFRCEAVDGLSCCPT